MELRELIIDVILTIIMTISTVVLVLRFWQDLICATAAALIALSLGGLFILLTIRVRILDENVTARERSMRVNLEEISNMMRAKYEESITHFDGIVEDLSRRMYR